MFDTLLDTFPFFQRIHGSEMNLTMSIPYFLCTSPTAAHLNVLDTCFQNFFANYFTAVVKEPW